MPWRRLRSVASPPKPVDDKLSPLLEFAGQLAQGPGVRLVEAMNGSGVKLLLAVYRLQQARF
jgi:hypothetical protein